MITTLTLNPYIDKMKTVDRFEYEGLNRILNTRTDIGGKGIMEWRLQLLVLWEKAP